MTPQELALKFALLKVLVTELGAAKTVADLEVRATWRPADRLTATLPNDTDIGTVTLANGAVRAAVADTEAYETWVRATHPEQIETVPETTRINPAFTARLTSAAKKLGVAVDAETGEEVPGITVAAGEPYPMVKLTKGAREAVAEAWQAGDLTELMAGLLAIEGGEES
jgi:hypothetical protein